MGRIALVVQRCGLEVNGGAEAYVLEMGRMLSERHDVDILSSTALDYITWAPHYTEGTESVSDRLRIIRFNPEGKRGDYWHALSGMAFWSINNETFGTLSPEAKERFRLKIQATPLAFQHEWMRRQGPYCPGLYDHLQRMQDAYDHMVFKTCLYPSTYYALERLGPRDNVWLIPTLHDEPASYLSIFRDYAPFQTLYLTDAELALYRRLIGEPPLTKFIGFGVQDNPAPEAYESELPYALYAGRIEPAKGLPMLFEHFAKYISRHPGLELRMIGGGPLETHAAPGVRYMGFVSEEEKLALMKGALALVHPSSFEALGIVIFEAFMQGTPAVVSASSQVLVDHVRNSGAGYVFGSYEEFERALNALRQPGGARMRMGARGREYYLTNYSRERYQGTLADLFG